MTTSFEQGYALLIGVNGNSVPEWALPDVAKDVDALCGVLTHPQRCGYPTDHVRLIKGADATRQKILEGLDWLQAQVAADASGNATAVIYYSGHGWRDPAVSPPSYYLIPCDVRKDRVRGTALRTEDFAEAVNAVQPRRLLVMLDCCHAGGMDVKDLTLAAGQFELAAVPPDLLLGSAQGAAKSLDEKGLEQLAVGAGRAVLSSSTGLQKSYVRSDHSMSIFTYHLVEALTGHAQPQDGASEVLVSDILSYVYRQVPQSAKQDGGHEQQPDGRITGTFAVAMLLGGKGLSKGEVAPDPLAALPPTSGISIGKIEAVNVGETQHIDQRGASFTIGGTHVQVSGSGSAAVGPGSVAAGAAGVAVGGDVHGGVRLGGIDTGGGAYVRGDVNTGGGDFVGRDRVVHGDVVGGDKVMGDKVGGDKIQFQGPVTADALAVGHGAQATSNRGIDPALLAQVLAPVAQAVSASQVDADQRAAAEAKVQELQQELAKGKDANDSRLARIVDGIVDLVPGAVAAVTGAFGSPILAGVAGPVTQFVLERLRGKA